MQTQLVKKAAIIDSGDFNLSANRYVKKVLVSNKYSLVKISDVAKIDFGTRITKSKDSGTIYPVYGGGGETFRTDSYNRENSLIISRFAMSERCVRFVEGKFFLNDSGLSLSIFSDNILENFLNIILLSMQKEIYSMSRGGAQKNLHKDSFLNLQIPLPPLEIQEQIVKEIEGYQQIIDGCRQVVENYKPLIDIDPSWEMVEFGKLIIYNQTGLIRNKGQQNDKYDYPYIKMGDMTYAGQLNFDKITNVNCDKKELNKYKLEKNDLLFNTRNTPSLVGKVAIFNLDKENYLFNNNIMRLRFVDNISPHFMSYILNIDKYKDELRRFVSGTTSVAAIYPQQLFLIKVPNPSMEIQKEIVEKLEQEREVIEGNKELILIYEDKINARINKVWSDN